MYEPLHIYCVYTHEQPYTVRANIYMCIHIDDGSTHEYAYVNSVCVRVLYIAYKCTCTHIDAHAYRSAASALALHTIKC